MDITQFVNTVTPLSPESQEKISALFSTHLLPRKSLIYQAGQPVHHLYFVESGLARIFYYNQQGKDVTYGFYPENQFVTIPESFFSHTTSRYYLELLEDSTLHSITYSDLMLLTEELPAVRIIENHVLRHFLLKASERIVALQFQTAEERYATLNELQPSILQRAPLGTIASYLGITQETLSRIRARRAV